MKILGVDPSLKATGYGVVEALPGGGLMGRIRLLECGTIEPKVKDALPDRLQTIEKNMTDIIRQFKPSVMVLEKLYSHHSYPTTSYILGHARGVICLCAAHGKIGLEEFSVKRIRKALVGNGNATKQQTREVVAHILGIQAKDLTLDASDALALSLGHIHMRRI